MEVITDTFDGLDMEVVSMILNTMDYGLAQVRRRMFLCAVARHPKNFTLKTGIDAFAKCLSKSMIRCKRTSPLLRDFLLPFDSDPVENELTAQTCIERAQQHLPEL